MEPPADTGVPKGWRDALAPAMLTCILQGALAGVIAHTVHTDTPVDTGVLHTVICVHSTGWPFKAGGTGTPVVGWGMKRNRENCGHWSAPSFHTFGVSTLDQRRNYSRPEGEQIRR